ncbi:calcium-binding protein [Synechococcus sp. RSCCF101]|uniref:calcium-binding protein n=1 Tax=Synechococcus sp. RSCCF101 TaxID=2511069 RepID=UPI001243E218|nr:calcium-binding protein [Synechococcus sp. RSCCF101]QEY31560.1 calcium-binding protein [Synechococcus sp. RSCCF101]
MTEPASRTANTLGAIPMVLTLSHTIDSDRLNGTQDSIFDTWTVQLLGDAARGNFNLGAGNTVGSPTGTDFQDLQGGSTGVTLSQTHLSEALKRSGGLLPALNDPSGNPDYVQAYAASQAAIGQVLDPRASNQDLLSLQEDFPVFWLRDIQNGQLLFATESPSAVFEGSTDNGFINSDAGAPDPSVSQANYILSEFYVGQSPVTAGVNTNNGDITYIEQFGIPASFNIWYGDGRGNLYRGVTDENAAALSVPGTGSYLSGDLTAVNNGSAFAAELVQPEFDPLRSSLLNPKQDGTLYISPKNTYRGATNSIVAPEFGDFYDAFHTLSSLPSGQWPIRWSGQFNQETAYRISNVTFEGFGDVTTPFPDLFDQQAYVRIEARTGAYSNGQPPSENGLTDSVTLILPWYGLPDLSGVGGVDPSNPAPAANRYRILNDATLTSQPTGGWSLQAPSTFTSTVALTPQTSTLQAQQGNTSVPLLSGSYSLGGYYQFYEELAGFSGSPGLLDWLTTELPLQPNTAGQPFSLSVSGTPAASIDWTALPWSDDSTYSLQVSYDADSQEWAMRGSGPQWNGIGSGSIFELPGGGQLPGEITASVSITQAPTGVSDLEQLQFITNDPQANTPIDRFELRPNGATGEAITLNLKDPLKANQLINNEAVNYLATTVGILGAAAGYLYQENGSGGFTLQPDLTNDVLGTIVGDFVSLVNAGLLGAPRSFTYDGNTLPVGQLAQLDPSYTVSNGTVTVSPWFDKEAGPVAAGLFGASVWDDSSSASQGPYFNTWASQVNAYAPNVYGFGLSDRFRDGYNVPFNLERRDLSPEQQSEVQLLQFNPQATSAADAFIRTDAASASVSSLYPLFAEFQIGGFEGGSTSFFPDYRSAATPPPSPAPAPSPAPTPTPPPSPTPTPSPSPAPELLDPGNRGLLPRTAAPGLRTIAIGSDTANAINGTGAGDFLAGRGADDVLSGERGNDDLRGNDGSDVLIGGSGSDALRGGKGRDRLNGGQGDDLLSGGLGSDVLLGGDGDDVLNGNQGSDTMTGGLGADRFLLNRGNDLITDFDLAQGDRLVVLAGQPLTFSQDGGDLLISRDGFGVTRLLNTDLIALQQANPAAIEVI